MFHVSAFFAFRNRIRFRIAGYVVEVKDCRGPSGAAPARVYYARTKEQRKARSPMGMEMYRIWA
jgi:hypothetical protein